jgi:hypothetical protein
LTQWDVTKTFYLGVEVLYSELHSANSSNNTVPTGNAFGGATTGTTQIKDQSNWMISVRAHRDFLP